MSQILQVNTTGVSIDRRILNTNTKVIVSQREFSKFPASAIGSEVLDLGPGLLVSAPVNLLSLDTNAEVAATITPGFVGRVVSAFAIVTTAVTTGSRSVAVRTKVDGVSLDGGLITITSAAATPAGKVIPGSKIVSTGDEDFDSNDAITFVVEGAPTTHAEGAVIFGVLLAPARKVGPAVV